MFAMLIQQQAAANAGQAIDNDEIVDLPSIGVRVRLRTVDAHPGYSLPAATQQYGFEAPLLTEISIETRTDA